MKVQEALIQLRDDLKEWITVNLNAIGTPKSVAEVTQEEYDELAAAGEIEQDVPYYISNGVSDRNNASTIVYDNSASGLTAGNVQGAIDELSKMETLKLSDDMTAYKIGKVVMLRIIYTTTITASDEGWQVLATLPEGYRPVATVNASFYDNNNTTYANSLILPAVVRANGEIAVYAYSDKLSTRPCGLISYLTA